MIPIIIKDYFFFSNKYLFCFEQKIPGESFAHMNGKRIPVHINQDNLFPYLLVNIGSGVGMIKVNLHIFSLMLRVM